MSLIDNRKNMVTVSICIRTYNRKGYLKQTLESIRAQTYQDYEIVIVDDGSTDGTDDMIRRLPYAVTYFWQKNAGVGAAANRLIDLAKGQYITPIDSDDLLMPDAVERMVRVMETESEDVIVYGPYLRIDENGELCGKSKEQLYSGYVTRHLFQRIFVYPSGSMFPKSVLQEVGSYDESVRVGEDYDLYICIFAESKLLVSLDQHSGFWYTPRSPRV